MRSTVVGPYESQTMTEISLVVERVNRHLKLKWLEEKGMMEDEMDGWHHRLEGCESE